MHRVNVDRAPTREVIARAVRESGVSLVRWTVSLTMPVPADPRSCDCHDLGRLPKYPARGASRPDGRGGATCRGKSGLHRAGWSVTPTRGDPRESATENRPPAFALARVKRWGKSPPAPGVTRAARQTPPGARSRGGPPGPLRRRSRAARPMPAGRPHEATGNGGPRWMTVARTSVRSTEPGLQADSSRLIVRRSPYVADTPTDLDLSLGVTDRHQTLMTPCGRIVTAQRRPRRSSA